MQLAGIFIGIGLLLLIVGLIAIWTLLANRDPPHFVHIGLLLLPIGTVCVLIGFLWHVLFWIDWVGVP